MVVSGSAEMMTFPPADPFLFSILKEEVAMNIPQNRIEKMR
jgi:hypothetical protein